MPSLRDDALSRLGHAEQGELLRLGASARLAEDDVAWILLAAAAVRLDLDRFTRIAAEHARARADRGIADLIEQGANRITDLARYAVQGARWDRPAHRMWLIAVTALVLLATHIAAFTIAERGWVGFLSADITELKRIREELRVNPPPDWLTWSADKSGAPAAFVARSPSQVNVRQCQLSGEAGTCIFVK